jgi:hypothetical protein
MCFMHSWVKLLIDNCDPRRKIRQIVRALKHQPAAWLHYLVGMDFEPAQLEIALSRRRYKFEEADQAYRVFDEQTSGKGVFECVMRSSRCSPPISAAAHA